MTPALLTVPELASLLRVSRAQVYVLKDRIGYVRWGRGIRFEPDAVHAFLQGARECHAPAVVSSVGSTPRSGRRVGPTATDDPTSSPRAVEIMERLLSGSRRAS
jgi:excisionase family DNA binding protein